jgi:hypothetical protein
MLSLPRLAGPVIERTGQASVSRGHELDLH